MYVHYQSFLQPCLDVFAQWVVTMITEQLQNDIARRNWNDRAVLLSSKNGGDGDEDEDDEDFEWGLFAEESYGGGMEEMYDLTPKDDVDDENQVAANGHDNARNNNDKHLLVDDVFALLSSVEDCPKVLTKPFLTSIVETYNQRVGIYNKGDSSNKDVTTATATNNDDDDDRPPPSLGLILLHQCLQRFPTPENTAVLDQDAICKQVTALFNLLTLCSDAVQVLAIVTTTPSSSSLPPTGSAWEDVSLLRALLCLAAYTTPRFAKNAEQIAAAAAAAENGPRRRQQQPADDLLPTAFHKALVKALEHQYPICLYNPRGYSESAAIHTYDSVVKDSRQIMKHARGAAALAMKRMAAASASAGMRKNGALLDWIRHVVEANEPMVDILESDLLKPNTAQATCSSQPFLLGMAASLLEVCGPSLSSKLQSDGVAAFDPRYLLREEEEEVGGDDDSKTKKKIGIAISSKERRLSDRAQLDSSRNVPTQYTGATEFFFLAAALLRVSLFHGFRVHEEVHETYSDTVSMIRTLAGKGLSPEELKQIPSYTLDAYQKCTTAMIGWTVFCEDPELSAMITAFSLVQLQWLSMIMVEESNRSSGKTMLSLIPEWFLKLPAQWIAHVALYTPHLLRPHQGEAAVQYATQLLRSGTTNDQTGNACQLSPPVLTSLIRIAGAFVRSGVNRARAKEKSRRGNRRKALKTQNSETGRDEIEEDFELELIDDRELDIYSSFDKRDLGVTVFTNELVSKHLCPTLIRTYYALDAVEGMDVEREHHFDKFVVKNDVADLLLRLWSHPSGDCRRSLIENLDIGTISKFASSAAGALGMLLDNACQNILDIQDIHSAHEKQYGHMQVVPPLSGRDMMYCQHHARAASSGLMGTRRLLMLLCQFSSEDKIAAMFSGSKEANGISAASDLAAMVVHVLDRLTNEDGGTHSELDIRKTSPETRSATMLDRFIEYRSTGDLHDYLRDLIFARRFVLLEYGLDVSLLAHQTLALAARWHFAAASKGKDGDRSSQFLDAIAKNDTFNIKQARNVYTRLLSVPRVMAGTELENAEYVLERDGHIDISIWKDLYKIPGSGPDQSRQRRRTARQERMEHAQIDSLLGLHDIQLFLDDLDRAIAMNETTEVTASWGEESMARLETKVLTGGSSYSDEDYNERLEEWVVSSESFRLSSGNGAFAHSYDTIARSRSLESIGSGRLLVKEAKKCKKVLPSPHPNASIFVCFAEERMDLCKAIIIGTVDTPYSLGMFEFDILFPTTYPSAPPLLTFKTTGDGQTRVSPNLYNDGKVCISILGTANAWNDSQRWNPSNSSLAQVLASIQTQILGVPDPFFSEGFSHNGIQGTTAGETGSKRYNNKLRLHTVRRAMIAPLRNPPLGFEEVTKRHFSMCRKRILTQVRRWTMEAEGTPLFHRFARAYIELATLLSEADLVMHRLPGQSADGEENRMGAIPPSADDLHALRTMDPAFTERVGSMVKSSSTDNKNNEKSNPRWVIDMETGRDIVIEDGTTRDDAGPGLATESDHNYNPWAGGHNSGREGALPRRSTGTGSDDEGDDDFYT